MNHPSLAFLTRATFAPACCRSNPSTCCKARPNPSGGTLRRALTRSRASPRARTPTWIWSSAAGKLRPGQHRPLEAMSHHQGCHRVVAAVLCWALWCLLWHVLLQESFLLAAAPQALSSHACSQPHTVALCACVCVSRMTHKQACMCPHDVVSAGVSCRQKLVYVHTRKC